MTTLKTSAKLVLFGVVALLEFAVLFAYGLAIGPVGAWILVWLALFASLLFLEHFKLETRGLWFLIFSVVLGVGGKKFFGDMDGSGFIIEVLSQVMILVGAGLGSNIMSTWLLEAERRADESRGQPDRAKDARPAPSAKGRKG